MYILNNIKYFLKPLILSLFLLLSFPNFVNGEEFINYGSNWEKSCIDDMCESKLYSFEKYWFNENEVWENINENWYDCSTDDSTQYCTNEYHFNVIARADGTVSSYLNGEEFTVKLSSLLNADLDFNPIMEGSVLTYQNILPGVDLRYQYLPRKLKEEIIIHQPLEDINSDFNIVFTKTGDANFIILESIICDANENCEIIEHFVDGDEIEITVPADFLNNPNTVYPVTIDPTIYLNDSYVPWNGRVIYSPGCGGLFCYDRFSNTKFLDLGKINATSFARGGMDWNISIISNFADVTNVSLRVYVTNSTTNNIFNITHMEGSNSTYPNNDLGNFHFYEDMGNGSKYAQQALISGNRFFNLSFNSLGIQGLEDSLASDIFSFGIDTDTNKTIRIEAADSVNASRRPVLAVNYFINTFNNSLTTEDLVFFGNQNITRYLDIDKNANVTSGFLNFSGLDTSISPSQAGAFLNSSSMDGAWDVFVEDGFAYVASFASHGLTIIDISNNNNPFQVGFFQNTTNAQTNFGTSIFVSEDIAYYGNSIPFFDNFLTIINISNKSSPTQISAFSNTSLNVIESIIVEEGLAYLTSTDDNALVIINVSNKSNPSQIGVFSNDSIMSGENHLDISDDVAFISSSGNNSLTIINISNPNNPNQISSFKNDTSLSIVRNIFVLDDFAYLVSQGSSSLTIVDISNFLSPIQVGYFLNNSIMSIPESLYVIGNTAFIVDSVTDTMIVVNVSDKNNPNQLYSFSNVSSINRANSIKIEDNFAYIVSRGSDGLTILEVLSPPTNPFLEIGTPNGNYEWNFTGEFNQLNVKTSDLSNAINVALNNGSCNCSDCHLNGNICSVPFLFHSDSSGIIRYSDFRVTYI